MVARTMTEQQEKRRVDTLDLERSILWQVGSLGKEYVPWVHSPSSRSYRLFDSDFFEFFSKTSWWAIPLVWIPVMFICGVKSLGGVECALAHYRGEDTAKMCSPDALLPKTLMGAAIIGLLNWSFMEYILHRFVFHFNPKDSPLLITIHFFLHGQHHKFPMDKGRLVFPPVAGLGIFMILFNIFNIFSPYYFTLGMMVGFITGYIAYDLTHYYLHHGQPKGTYLLTLKKYHADHHYRDHKAGYGISTVLWDIPFGTLGIVPRSDN